MRTKSPAGPLAIEIHHVLTTPHGGLVTIGGVLALYFSSSGIESLRIGLNRAYELRERRSFWVLRLESIGFVLLSAIALVMLAVLIVLGPLLFKAAAAYVPALAPLESHYDFARFGVSGGVVVASPFILHMWLPAGRRGFGAVWPGILATMMVLWLICGFAFGHYLAEFAYTYVNYYARQPEIAKECGALATTDVAQREYGQLRHNAWMASALAMTLKRSPISPAAARLFDM